MVISACGLVCSECHFFRKECSGCYEVEGAPFWAKDISENGKCPLYECSVIQKGFKSCGQCSELPCIMFQDLKDPNVSEQEHKKALSKRVALLSPGKKY